MLQTATEREKVRLRKEHLNRMAAQCKDNFAYRASNHAVGSRKEVRNHWWNRGGKCGTIASRYTRARSWNPHERVKACCRGGGQLRGIPCHPLRTSSASSPAAHGTFRTVTSVHPGRSQGTQTSPHGERCSCWRPTPAARTPHSGISQRMCAGAAFGGGPRCSARAAYTRTRHMTGEQKAETSRKTHGGQEGLQEASQGEHTTSSHSPVYQRVCLHEARVFP